MGGGWEGEVLRVVVRKCRPGLTRLGPGPRSTEFRKNVKIIIRYLYHVCGYRNGSLNPSCSKWQVWYVRPWLHVRVEINEFLEPRKKAHYSNSDLRWRLFVIFDFRCNVYSRFGATWLDVIGPLPLPPPTIRKFHSGRKILASSLGY